MNRTFKSLSLSVVGVVIAASGVAITFFLISTKLDTIHDLWVARTLNVLVGAFFGIAFILISRSIFAPVRVRTTVIALSIFAITLTCLELWCEGIANARWRISDTSLTRNRISLTRGGLFDYARDCGSFPSRLQGLDVLVKNPGIVGWKGPYVSDNDILDSWGNPLKYRVTEKHVEVWSVGPDGQDGTDDDIR
jgi:general secretion pathway protein G